MGRRKTIILSGDPRQCAPVVEGANEHDIIAASIVGKDLLNNNFHKFRLSINMRLYQQNLTNHQRQRIAAFQDDLLKIGEGRMENYVLNHIVVPQNFGFTGNLDQFIEEIYRKAPGMAINLENEQSRSQYCDFLLERSIVTPINRTVDELNRRVNNKLQTQLLTVYSEDGVEGQAFGAMAEVPIELINSTQLNGWPSHVLELKIGSEVMVLRNISPILRNGTRVVVRAIQNRCIMGTIITGPNRKTDVLIPRIKFLDEDMKSGLAHVIYRKQFPLRLCWAMTINKSQGQSLGKAWLYLEEQCFAHGQLYVAMSRATAPESIKIFTALQKDNHRLAANYVCRELLL